MIEAALAAIESNEQRNELSDFYEKNKKRFFNVAYSKLNNEGEAEEVVQEAFLRVVSVPDKFFNMTNHDRIRFVEGIVRHVAIDDFNKTRKNAAISIEDIGNSIADGEISPEEKYITDVAIGELKQFALTLPEKERETLFMYVHHGLSYSEISKILGISEELARKRVSNARKAIKNFIEREE